MRRTIPAIAAAISVLSGLGAMPPGPSPAAAAAAASAGLRSRLGAGGSVKAWVFFADKGSVEEAHRVRAFRELEESYPDRAIARRRLRRTSPGLFDERDLPVHPDHLAGIAATGADVLLASRWLNAASVRIASPAQAEAIARLPYVTALDLVNRGATALPVPAVGKDEGSLAPAGFYGIAEAQLAQLDLPALHARGFTGDGVVVAVLDTGFRRTHAVFNEPGHPLDVIAEWDFVEGDANTAPEPGDPANQEQHGTWVLAALAGYKPFGLVGPAYDASYILCKVEDATSEYPLEEDWFVAGLEFAEAHGADVVSSSLVARWYAQEDLDGVSSVMARALNTAAENGVHCCQGAGNEGHDADPAIAHLLAPADAFSAITCGAVTSTGATASFSSDGPTADGRLKPEVLARGLEVWTVSQANDTGYEAISGTSLATPLVAGVVACIVQARPEWSVALMRFALTATASDYAQSGVSDPLFVRGFGIVDADAAADFSLTATEPGAAGAPSVVRAAPNPSARGGSLELALERPQTVQVRLFDAGGRLVRTLADGFFSVGLVRIVWDGRLRDGREAPAGTYYWWVRTDRGRQSGRWTIVR